MSWSTGLGLLALAIWLLGSSKEGYGSGNWCRKARASGLHAPPVELSHESVSAKWSAGVQVV